MRISVIGLGTACLAIRDKTKWSQVNLANKLKVTQITISRWEKSKPDEVLRVHHTILNRVGAVLASTQVENNIKVIQ